MDDSTQPVDASRWSIINNLSLTDPDFAGTGLQRKSYNSIHKKAIFGSIALGKRDVGVSQSCRSRNKSGLLS